MRRKPVATLLILAALVLSTFAALSGTTPAAAAPSGPRWPIKGYAPSNSDNAILRWDEQLLSTIRAYPPQTGPTVTARAIGILHTATYDAWAAYDSAAKGTRYLDGLRQSEAQRTGQLGLENKKKAISFAAYRVLMDLFPPAGRPGTPPVPPYPSKPNTYFVPDVLMKTQPPDGFGYDPAETDSTPAVIDSPAEVGYAAADAVLNERHKDGSNQLNNYANTTTYQPTNKWNEINPDPTKNGVWHWQPLCVLTAKGLAEKQPLIRNPSLPCPDTNPPTYYTVQNPLHPQWGNIQGFALDPATQMPPHFSVPGPPKLADGSYDPSDIDTALADTSNLDAVKKAKAEYWADGPQSEFPPGHTMVFAQALSRMRSHTLDQDAKLFFMLGNALMDASISAWKAKYDPRWDFVRPITGIRERYRGKQITSWLGPNLGYGNVLGENWLPYQAPTVVTPPFPEYVSGHSTFTAAGRAIMGGFEGSDKFNAQVVIGAGSSTYEANTPATAITLTWKTLTAAADEAGWSRRWGGIHFKSGDEHGRLLGKVVASDVWDKAQTYFNGSADKPA